jgi:hypothetical protein
MCKIFFSMFNLKKMVLQMLVSNIPVCQRLSMLNQVLGKLKIILKRLSKYFYLFRFNYKNKFFSELQAMNDDTVDKLHENQIRINKNRHWLLQDKAGVAPRMYRFDLNTVCRYLFSPLN